ncbi:MAG TPA: CU044_2847 family protein [Methylomirabilota bacterium]|nr:CU044_2847 family protein [Methylomirabilota bacterium]
MAEYLQFTNQDGSNFLVETKELETSSLEGIVDAGLDEVMEKAVVKAQTLFEQAVEVVIKHNSKAFLQAVRNLQAENQPESMEVTFALKATGEVGNIAIARAGGEANYSVKLTWKR